MTTLRDLQAAAAFDPSPLRADLPRTHVPFEDLVPGANVETNALDALCHTERIAVVGPTGSGKSSLIGHLLAGTDRVAGIRVSVEAQSPEVVTEPAAFAGHVLRELGRLSDASRLLRSRRRLSASARAVTVEQRRRARGGVNLPTWLADASVAAEMESAVSATFELPSSELFEAAHEAIVTITASTKRFPVIVIDDSDAWLRTDLADRSQLVGGFFGRVLHRVADEWAVGLLVAVHDDYLTNPAYPRASGSLSKEIRLPRLPDHQALRQIVAARIAAVSNDADQTALVSDAALAEMYR